MKNIWSKILKIPLILVVISSFIASLYPAYGFRYSISIFLGIIIALYFLGEYLGRNKKEIDQNET
ncbi:MAG TPA: hypothetical protein VMZ91_02910 [Candidatus Paceibacterota bacterium]|nr:hypothetical protein [Candidatus Paceibacterota bacterium]